MKLALLLLVCGCVTEVSYTIEPAPPEFVEDAPERPSTAAPTTGGHTGPAGYRRPVSDEPGWWE